MAQRQLVSWGLAIGLQVWTDDIGNIFMRLPGDEPHAAPVLSGSHLDSQPTGGRFDGAYGVLAALEAVHAIASSGLPRRRPIDVVAWMNEEGSRFAPGMMGSAVFAGARSLEETLAVTDRDGISVGEALRSVQSDNPALQVRAAGAPVFACIEAHIEQGPVLEQRRIPVGVVTGIQGKHTYRVTVTGVAAHAGTAPVSERKDALMAALGMVQAMRDAFADPADAVKFTVGRFSVSPNAPSVVPAQVEFSIDLRHPDSAVLQALSAQVPDLCEDWRENCEVTVERLVASDACTFPSTLQAVIHAAADTLGVPTLDLLSMAGHDAGYIQKVAPTAMIFVPSHQGITHNEREFTSMDHMITGTRVLADVLYRLAA